MVAATVQSGLQAVVGILMATSWRDELAFGDRSSNDVQDAVLALLWVHNAVCVSLTNSYFLLAAFHTYLLWIRSGTYDFILENGSDGLCARLLKCRCLKPVKKRKVPPHHHHTGTTTAPS